MSNIAPIDIKNLKRVGLNIIATYWSPQSIDETKILVFVEVKPIIHVDESTGEEKILPTAVFADPVTHEIIHQASARLVGAIQREKIEPMTIWEITYKGKVKNSTNAFQSDSWSMYKLEQA